ncbi:MAG TPA: Glu-tRNA(Gln) amidotransferase subunit GatE [Methanomassiliicoccales archaeon]|nr:Glu-tRNA(Gln) amidotransferase subunit GatE [Methanomassiliicoccales archaeon]
MFEVTIGIEIHQQLDTCKLFCSCRSQLVDEEGALFFRRLRPTQSEMGEVDRAVLAQAERRMHFAYQAPSAVSCLVEKDEEPPHDADEEAMQTVLIVSAMLDSKVMDEVHFMRKIVIDGSNTSGFQRTALVAVDGALEVNGHSIGILSVCLEEDAARKVETKDRQVTYRLDRLGIPLIEIATAPDMHDPEEVKEVAQRLGSILRSTRKVKRGLGTIREDLNVSIPGGARVEIKGAQDLSLLPTYVRNEMERQRSLIEIKQILEKRSASPVPIEAKDISALLQGSRSKVIHSALSKGGKVFCASLPSFVGTLRSADGRLRLGSEMAQHARSRGVAGIFHSDELPAYGITSEEVVSIRKFLGLGDMDAFALCADQADRAEPALLAALSRANQALTGVPEETRDPLPDGTSLYSRPLPGAGRMYPETDVRPILIEQDRLLRIKENLPELPEARTLRLVRDYGINEQQSRQLVREGHDELFEDICKDASLVAVAARTFLSTYPEMQNEGVDPGSLDDVKIKEAFSALTSGRFTKEALPAVFREMVKGASVDQAVSSLGLEAMDQDEASKIIDELIGQRADFVREKGTGAVGPLMGVAMNELRGKIDGKEAADLLKKRVEAFLKG